MDAPPPSLPHSLFHFWSGKDKKGQNKTKNRATSAGFIEKENLATNPPAPVSFAFCRPHVLRLWSSLSGHALSNSRGVCVCVCVCHWKKTMGHAGIKMLDKPGDLYKSWEYKRRWKICLRLSGSLLLPLSYFHLGKRVYLILFLYPLLCLPCTC